MKRLALRQAPNSKVKNKWQKGSSRIGAVCPAFIRRTVKGRYAESCLSDPVCGEIIVKAQLSHYGHKRDVLYTPLGEAVREDIAKLLRELHRVEDIPDILRQSLRISFLMTCFAATQRDPASRGYHVKVEDVRRVADSLGLGRFNRRNKDHESVDSLMSELLKTGSDSPVLLYRPATAENKICIVLQTASMRQAMIKFGRDVLCCDTTHDTTRYPGILLGTLMTVGAAGEGQPVAFFIVGAESEAELSPAFESLASRYTLRYDSMNVFRIPEFRTRYFMSDGANAFWNSFKKYFDVSQTIRQLCTWHIWRNWIAKLLLISSDEHRRRARAGLRVLMGYCCLNVN
jgi:hypothetical protein